MGELLIRSSPTPPQEFADKDLSKEIHSALTDSRRKRHACFCCRELPGATETLVAQKVDFFGADRRGRRLLQ